MWHVRKNNCHDLRFTFNQRSWNCEQSTRLLRHGLARKTDDCTTLSNIGIPSPKSWSVKNLAAAGSARQRQQPTCGGKVRQSARSQELPVLAAGGKRFASWGIRTGPCPGRHWRIRRRIIAAARLEPNQHLHPPLSTSPTWNALPSKDRGRWGRLYLSLCKYHQIFFAFVQISPNIICLCANITIDSLNAITSFLKLEPFQHPQKTIAVSFVQKKARQYLPWQCRNFEVWSFKGIRFCGILTAFKIRSYWVAPGSFNFRWFSYVHGTESSLTD